MWRSSHAETACVCVHARWLPGFWLLQAQPAPLPVHMAAELDRLARRDDALTAAVYAYGLIACLMTIAYCVNQSLLGGEGVKASRRCCRKEQKTPNEVHMNA